MGPTNHLPNDSTSQPQARPAEEILQALGQDLDALRQKVSSQLMEDIAYLQNRKDRLMGDIEALEEDFAELQTRHQQLQASQSQTLTDQQIAQQQVWAKRLAQALATHLQARLEASLLSSGAANGNGVQSFAEASQRLATLDTTLHSTLQSLQQDLNSYHSTLSQQVVRMHNIEQQGEAILEALVTRLSQQLQRQMVQPVAPAHLQAAGSINGHRGIQLPPTAHTNGYGGSGLSAASPPTVTPQPATSGLPPWVYSPDSIGTVGGGRPDEARHGLGGSPTATPASLSARPTGVAAVGTGSQGHLKVGLILVMLATLALSIHNVLVGLIGYGGMVFGRLPVDSIFPLTIPNSLMLLWLRMVVVVPLMALVAAQLRPTIRQDMRQLFTDHDRRPLIQVLASGSFLFLSQVLIYKAISDVGPGVAVTVLFMYPLITVPLAWFLFGDRPTPLRLVVMFAITMGIVFTALPRIYSDLSGQEVSLWGVGAAMLSSAAFALYLIVMQMCFRRHHPVPVSLLQFCTVFGLTSLILIVGSFFGLQPSEPSSQWGLYLGGLMLGLLTLMGYLCNNYGVKLMGAAQASIVAASGPVVTAILAYLITPGEKSSLQFIQWMGVVLVTLGVISLSLERLTHAQRKAPRTTHFPDLG